MTPSQAKGAGFDPQCPPSSCRLPSGRCLTSSCSFFRCLNSLWGGFGLKSNNSMVNCVKCIQITCSFLMKGTSKRPGVNLPATVESNVSSCSIIINSIMVCVCNVTMFVIYQLWMVNGQRLYSALQYCIHPFIHSPPFKATASSSGAVTVLCRTSDPLGY